MNKNIGFSIQSRLLSGFIILCACIAIFGFFSSGASVKALTEEVQLNSLQFADGYITDLKMEIDRQQSQLLLVASASRIWEIENVELFIEENLMKKMFYIYGYQIFDRIKLMDSEGICIADTAVENEVGRTFSDEHWWAPTVEEGFHQYGIEQSAITGELYFPVSIKLEDDDNNFSGVLRAYINMATLTHIVELKGKVYKTTRVRLYNGQGQLLYSTGSFRPLEQHKEDPVYLKASESRGFFAEKVNGANTLCAYATETIPGHEEAWKLIIEQKAEEVLMSVFKLRITTYIILLIILAVAIIISFLISKSITGPLSKLNSAVKAVGPDNLAERTNIKTKDEVGLISQAYDQMMDMLEEQTENLKIRDWLQTGQNRMAESIRGRDDIKKLCNDVLNEICEYTHADIGAFFIMKEGVLKRTTAYNYLTDEDVPDTFSLNEGFVGQAAADRIIRVVDKPPENYIYYGSDMVKAVPKKIIIIPLVYSKDVKGVVELAFTTEIGKLTQNYLEEISESIAIALSSLQSMEQERALLRKTEEQKQELQAQQEELRVSNEELEEQSRQLRISESKLLEQRVELEESNVELEEKNNLLEEKQHQISAARKKLEEKARNLILASKYKSEFLSNMSHELRTPLNSLLLLAKELAGNEEGNLTDDQVESAEIIYNGGNDLLNLINQILDLSRIEAGRLELYIDQVYLSNLKNSIETAFLRMANEKSIGFTVIINKETPESIRTDNMRLEQIIRNLLGNAIKFTSVGEVNVVFSKSDRISGGGIRIDVVDTGIGISGEQQQIIFEAFQQADGSTSRRYGGTGLGLSIVRELAALLQGEIELESKPGEGSRFSLYLPSDLIVTDVKNEKEIGDKVPAEELKTIESELLPEKEVTDDRTSITDDDKVILIIEDDAKFQKIVMKHCRKEGYKCISALDGYKGVFLAAKYLPDGIILDMQLPGIDGHGVLKRLKENKLTMHIPVHIISVQSPTIDVYKEGAIGFLNKPVSKEQIDDVIRKLSVLSADRVRKLLIIEDDEVLSKHIAGLFPDESIEVTQVRTGKGALKLLENDTFHCIILDLGLPDISGNELLKTIRKLDTDSPLPPVIIYTGKDITEEEEIILNEYSSSIIIKDIRSDNRLIDEVSLFLHKVVESGVSTKKQINSVMKESGVAFVEGRILIVDDDMRTLFALSKILGARGFDTLKAESGEKALKLLAENNDVDLVLMDIMMPEMDGYEAIRRMKADEDMKDIPVIALTAKAMKGDREKCLKAGANDYLTKPVDSEKLLSLIKVWLYRQE